jgi:hypothetical protein
MPSTFTTNTGIEKPGDGEQAGLWGTTANTSYDILDRAVNGAATVLLTGPTYTLTTSNGTLSEGQYAAILFTGTPGATCTVTVAPSTAQKTYLMRNGTNQSVVITQGSGGNVAIPAGVMTAVACTGGGASAAVYELDFNLGTIATQNADNVAITGGAISGITDLAVADGGTGASDAAGARGNLGLGTMATQDTYNIDASSPPVEDPNMYITGPATGAFGLNLYGGSSEGYIYAYNGVAGDYAGIGVGTTLAYIDTNSDVLAFFVANNEQARIHASGGVSIGSVTDPGAASLLVAGALTFAGTATITGGTQNWTVTASSTNLTFAYNGVNKMRLDSSGNITVTGNVTAYGTIT